MSKEEFNVRQNATFILPNGKRLAPGQKVNIDPRMAKSLPQIFKRPGDPESTNIFGAPNDRSMKQPKR